MPSLTSGAQAGAHLPRPNRFQVRPHDHSWPRGGRSGPQGMGWGRPSCAGRGPGGIQGCSAAAPDRMGTPPGACMLGSGPGRGVSYRRKGAVVTRAEGQERGAPGECVMRSQGRGTGRGRGFLSVWETKTEELAPTITQLQAARTQRAPSAPSCPGCPPRTWTPSSSQDC